ncbi:MAG TPA: sugar transferase, partial [Acidimicrobiales bacterium]|nr:sugar transferase [Acidimicrobiales bacterium]
MRSPAPVLFRHQRIGMDGRPFERLKFRTMEDGADTRPHERYVTEMIRGNGTRPDGALYKLVGDKGDGRRSEARDPRNRSATHREEAARTPNRPRAGAVSTIEERSPFGGRPGFPPWACGRERRREAAAEQDLLRRAGFAQGGLAPTRAWGFPHPGHPRVAHVGSVETAPQFRRGASTPVEASPSPRSFEPSSAHRRRRGSQTSSAISPLHGGLPSSSRRGWGRHGTAIGHWRPVIERARGVWLRQTVQGRWRRRTCRAAPAARRGRYSEPCPGRRRRAAGTASTSA